MLIHNGMQVPGTATVDRTATFTDAKRHARRRKMPVRAVLWHFTGGEGNVDTMCRTLASRRTAGAPDGLSVHLYISQAGVIYQLADLDLVTLHAGVANEFAIGIEVANKGRGPSHKKWPRDKYTARVHGRRVTFLDFYPEQYRAAKALNDALLRLFGLPCARPGTDALLSPKVLGEFKGVLGHYHVSRHKTDPGPRLLDALVPRE